MVTNKTQGFHISVTCPGCGADLRLESNFFVLTCKYCNSTLRVIMPDLPPVYLAKSRQKDNEIRFAIDRFLKVNSMTLLKGEPQLKKVYFPYWKVDASILKVRNKIHERILKEESDDGPEIKTKTEKTDLTVSPYTVTIAAGAPMRGVPESIGIRGESLRVEPFSKENIEENFNILPILKPWNLVWAQASSSVAIMGDITQADFGSNLTEMLFPDFEIIYFPYYIAETYDLGTHLRFVIDGITCRVLDMYNPLDEYADDTPDEIIDSNHHSMSSASVSVEQRKGWAVSKIKKTEGSENLKPVKMEFGELLVELHRCPGCGVDLPDKKSYIYVCKNCENINSVEKSKFTLEAVKICDFELRQNDLVLPFWSVTLGEDKLKKMKFIFGGMFNSDSLVVPGFKTRNYDALLRLARRMSFAKLKFNFLQSDTFSPDFHPVEISIKQAVRQASLLLYREKIAKFGKHKENIEEISPVRIELLYVPFQLQNYFYLDSILNSVTLEKRMVEV